MRCINVCMTLLIVMLHCLPDANSTFVVRLLGSVADVAVPAFFTMSAFLYFNNWEPSFGVYKKKIYSRIKSLVIPFVFYNLALWAWYSVTVVLGVWNEKPQPPLDVMGILSYLYWSEGDPPLWYLRSLFCFVLIAPIIYRIVKISRYSLLLVFFLPVCLYRLPYASMLFWTPCLILGTWLAIYYKEVTNIYETYLKQSSYTFWMIIFLVILFEVYINLNPITRNANLVYCYYRIISPFVVAYLFTKTALIPHKLVTSLAPMAFFIYAIHFPIKEVLSGVAVKLGGG